MTKKKQTTVLNKDSHVMKRILNQQTSKGDATTHISEKEEVLLVIRGMIERLMLAEDTVYKLGRFDYNAPDAYHIDLTPYGAGDRGVSRIHAQVHMENAQVYISDLGSTNGTFLGGERLEPNTATLLHKGDEVLLGRLSVQFMFR